MNFRRTVVSPLIACAALGCSSKRISKRDAGPVRISEDMASVPAGWFSQGCYRLLAASPAANEMFRDSPGPSYDIQRMLSCVSREPPRRVWVSSFEIDRFEVTRGEYEQCRIARACERPANDGDGVFTKPDIAALVTFEDANAFCKWRNKRLPTNAEWEKAARGTDDRIYPWGDTPPTCRQIRGANLERDGFLIDRLECNESGPDIRAGHLHPTAASPYGVEDLIDNADEWISDWYVEHVAALAVDVRVDDTKLVESDTRPSKPDERFWFSMNTTDPQPVIEFDWNSLRFAWADSSVIDPQGPPEPTKPGVPTHGIKDGDFGISGMDHSTAYTDDTGRSYAGFRCARSAKGPSAPTVTSPKPGEFALPFREENYSPSATAPKSATATRATKAALRDVSTNGQ